MSKISPSRIAAVAGFLGVALGAFGAHGLREILAKNETAAIWDTAVFYHLIHAVMLFILAEKEPFRRGAWLCFLAGIAVFSGTLYLLALTNIRWLGAITPIGGVSLLVGWFWLALASKQVPSNRSG